MDQSPRQQFQQEAYPPPPRPSDLIGRVNELEGNSERSAKEIASVLAHLQERVSFLERQVGTSYDAQPQPAKAPGY